MLRIFSLKKNYKTKTVLLTSILILLVYIIDTTCFDECFSFHVITGRHFLHKFIVTERFGATTMLLRSLKQVFWNKPAFYVRYLRNNITVLLIPKVQNKTFMLLKTQRQISDLLVFSVCLQWKQLSKVSDCFSIQKLTQKLFKVLRQIMAMKCH